MRESLDYLDREAVLGALSDKWAWQDLDPRFLDKAGFGDGNNAALLSPAGFRFFLPAYLIADLDHLLTSVPTAHLAGCLQDVLLEGFGRAAARQFALFTRPEVEAIVAYLDSSARLTPSWSDMVAQALRNYWIPRLEAMR